MTLRYSGIALVLVIVAIGLYGVIKVRQVSSAYLFGYPIVLMDLTRRAQLGEQISAISKADYRTNHFTHNQTFPNHEFRNVVRPNTDTLYSIAWLDLASEPMVLSVPDMQDRYYVMPIMDAWTNVDGSIGKRLSGTQAGDFLISGPDWQGTVPNGLEHMVANTNMNWIIGRIQTNGVADIPTVSRFQEQIYLTPLSRWGARQPNPNLFVKRSNRSRTVNPSQQLDAMSGVEFFAYLARLMKQQPAVPNDSAMLNTLQKLEPSSSVILSNLERGLVEFSVRVTKKRVKKAVTGRKANENGWNVVRDTIGDYGTNYRLRAAVAMIGLGAIQPAEASYPNASIDSQAQILTGQYAYKLHFSAGQLPPAHAFWSLSLYDKDGFFIENSIGRYAIGDRDSLVHNADGSLDILIQHSEPSATSSNWLPAPKGEFEVTMRVYHPKDEFIDGRWRLPAIERVTP